MSSQFHVPKFPLFVPPLSSGTTKDRRSESRSLNVQLRRLSPMEKRNQINPKPLEIKKEIVCVCVRARVCVCVRLLTFEVINTTQVMWLGTPTHASRVVKLLRNSDILK